MSTLQDPNGLGRSIHAPAHQKLRSKLSISSTTPSISGGLSTLNVTRISDKAYHNKLAMPLRGVETPNMNISNITPFWGLMSPELESSVNRSTVRADKLYIPPSMDTMWLLSLSSSGIDFLPGSQGSPGIWNSIYGSTISTSGFNYSRSTNLALLQKWRRNLTNTTGAAQTVNLIWTDYAANYFTGTRSWLTAADSLPSNLQETNQKRDVDNSSTDGQVPVQVYQRAETKTWVEQVGRKTASLLDPSIVLGNRPEKPNAGTYSLVDQKDNTNVATNTAIEVE